MSTTPRPVDEDSSSSSSSCDDGVNQEDYIKLRNMINKHIIDPLQQQQQETEEEHHHHLGPGQGGGGSVRPTAVTYKNLISLLLPTAQEYHNMRKRKQTEETADRMEGDGQSMTAAARPRPAVAALDTELDWQPGIRTHSPRTPTPPTLHFREKKGDEGDSRVFTTAALRQSLSDRTSESLRVLQLYRGFCICNPSGQQLALQSGGLGRVVVRMAVTRSRHVELPLDLPMPLRAINVKGEVCRVTIGSLWLLVASRSLPMGGSNDVQRSQQLVKDVANKFGIEVLDSARERQLLLAYLTGRSTMESLVGSDMWCPVEADLEAAAVAEGKKKRARVDPGDSCSARAEAVGRRLVLEEQLASLKEQLREATKHQHQQQAAASKPNLAVSRAVAALMQKTKAAASSSSRPGAETGEMEAPDTPSSPEDGEDGHAMIGMDVYDEGRGASSSKAAFTAVTADAVAAASSNNPELIALEVELEAKLQLQKQILVCAKSKVRPKIPLSQIEYYRVSDQLRMERELVACYQRRGRHLEVEKARALTILLEHTKGAEVDADLKQCQLAVTPRTLKAQEHRTEHHADLAVQGLHM
ncbi:hypothetical protein FOZ63_017039 [Perkinsus olseni]|uniref:Uncharacterized protein n=2 Tax=Perkinsus olseni TaxID=32597 RepID=A0A7J6QV33_PEROL|nr:hypothetical protein FOZ63_017039 [Perkinsus olseni]